MCIPDMKLAGSERTLKFFNKLETERGWVSEDISFFFFQAEDGIRDLYVTGVQTCALPISPWALAPPNSPRIARLHAKTMPVFVDPQAPPLLSRACVHVPLLPSPSHPPNGWRNGPAATHCPARSEERRVGKECRSRGALVHV